MNLKNIMLSGKPDEWFLLRMNDWEGAVGLLWSKTNKRHLGTSKGHSAVYVCQKRLNLYGLYVNYTSF